MKEFFRWSKGLIMPAVYVHLSGRDVDKALMELYGLSKEDKNKPLLFKAKKCPKYGFVNPPYARFCMKCGERLF